MDPFAIRDLNNPKPLQMWPEHTWHGFKLDADLKSGSLHLAEGAELELSDLEPDVLKLSIEDVSLDIHHTGSTVTASQSYENHSDQESENRTEIDIWDAASLSCREMKNGLLSWDGFNDRHIGAQSSFLSEARDSVYNDVIIQDWQAKHHETLRYARLDIFIQSALNALVGRSSQGFAWDDAAHSFSCRFGQVALTGHSPELTVALLSRLCQCGSMFGVIRAFCKVFESSCATIFALQSSLLQILGAMEADLQRKMDSLCTPVRIADICDRYTKIYGILQTIVATAQNRADEADLLADIIEYLTKTWFINLPLRPMLTNLADRILQPSIRRTQQQIDLLSDTGASSDDSWVLAALLPEDNFTFQEVLRCLQVGREAGVHIGLSRSSIAPIRITHQWSDLVEVQNMADSLEASFCKDSAKADCDRKAQTGDYASRDIISLISNDPFLVDFDMASKTLSSPTQGCERDTCLSDLVLKVLGDEDNGGDESRVDLSPTEMLSMSIRPILSAQHRICSYSLLRSLFLQQNLVAHLDLLYSYHLLGDGCFAARLSRALFDADQYSAEGRRKTGLSAGLRLENRDIWPPASSELRLVLMGLLSESAANKHLPDLMESISFAIRELSEDEMELCRDVHSVHALDFLRLTYAPPNHTLELIISPKVLDKYDRIFKFLLVLLRMHALSQNLLMGIVNRDANPAPNKHYHRLCIELHQFVGSFVNYTLNVAVGMTWSKMTRFLQEVHDTLVKDDYDRCMSIVASVDHISKMHEDTLDDVLTAMFLNKSQTKLYTSTCQIFQIGLNVAQAHVGSISAKMAATQYKELRKALSEWFHVAERISDKTSNRGFQMGSHLFNQVDGSGYYQRAKKEE